MAVVFTGILILIVMGILRFLWFIVTIPFRIIRVLLGGTFFNPPRRVSGKPDPFDYWMDDQGL